MTQKPGFYGGIPTMQQFSSPGILSRKVGSIMDDGSQEGPNWRYGGLVTYEKPIKEWYPDILIPVNAAGSSTTLRSGNELPNNCVGFRVIGTTANPFAGGVSVSINGGGLRTVLNGDVYGNTEIDSIVIVTDATGTCTIQPHGTGD
jgi:hypothetical protein